MKTCLSYDWTSDNNDRLDDVGLLKTYSCSINREISESTLPCSQQHVTGHCLSKMNIFHWTNFVKQKGGKKKRKNQRKERWCSLWWHVTSEVGTAPVNKLRSNQNLMQICLPKRDPLLYVTTSVPRRRLQQVQNLLEHELRQILQWRTWHFKRNGRKFLTCSRL
jgi:hypothetical protein